MTLQHAIKVLEAHQEWRTGGDGEPTDPKDLTEAMDIAINILNQLNHG